MIDNITLYKTFVTVARQESISAAARTLFLSQPAVSAEVAQLEEKLGTLLFFRTNRGVSLTPEGRLLYEYVEQGFSFLEAGEDKLREIAGLSGGVLRIGASDMTLRFFLLDYIERFHRAYPGVMLTVTNAPTPQTLTALRSGLLDFGVISEDGAGADALGDDFSSVPLRQIHDVFVAAPGHPLTGKTGVTEQELSDCPLIMLEPKTSTRRYVERMLGGSVRPTIELATSDLILEFARRRLGVASIVEDFAAGDLAAGTLCRLKLARPLPARRFLLVFLSRLPLSAAAQRMISDIKTGVREKEADREGPGEPPCS